MTPDAQRCAIAEACGWRHWPSKHGHFIVQSPSGAMWEPMAGQPRFDSQTGEAIERHWADGVHDLPDYLADLNAMNSAEKILTQPQKERYASLLHGQHRDQETRQPFLELDFCVLHATAEQRAKAFLRTIGKWEEPK